MSVEKVPNRRFTTIEKNLARLLKMRLLIGIPGSEGNHSGSNAPLWLVGYVQEHGDDQLHIPARPFLVPGVRSVLDQITKHMAEAAATVLTGGSLTEAEKLMMRAGLIGEMAVKQRIETGPFVPLKPATIYKRKHRKKPPPRDRDTPLFDTGELHRAITHAIDKG